MLHIKSFSNNPHNLFLVLFALLTLNACTVNSVVNNSTTNGDGDALSEGDGMNGDDTFVNPVNGKWLSVCMNLGGDSMRVYVEVDQVNQSTAFLYSTGVTDCSGTYALLGPDFQPSEGPALAYTLQAPFLSISGMPEEYIAMVMYGAGDSEQQNPNYQLLYHASETKFYSSGNPETSNPGSNWSDWLGLESNNGAFANDYTTGIEFNKVSGLPENPAQ